MMTYSLNELEEKIGYSFKDKTLLEKALSHSSYVNERGLKGIDSNERLEFLGDAVLELVSSDYLFHNYPDMNEGGLTRFRAKLVCEPALSAFSERIDLKKHILLGVGEEKTGGRSRKSIIADCMEAVIGAIYLDAGLDMARDFILKHILFDVEHAAFFKDNKTMLQELLQARAKIPKYTLIHEEGPPHFKTFTVEVTVDGSFMGKGMAHNKKEAEQEAAAAALKSIKGDED